MSTAAVAFGQAWNDVHGSGMTCTEVVDFVVGVGPTDMEHVTPAPVAPCVVSDRECPVGDGSTRPLGGTVVEVLHGTTQGDAGMIRTRHDLTRAIRRAEDQGGRLAAGSALGGKTERQELGRLLLDLADVARRAYDPASARDWVDAMPQDGAA